MSTDFPTLPTGPLPHMAMDYARLRAEGLRLLGRLGGAQWTDFNTHDPGITILEQLCFAITELAYRSNFPLPDLLFASPHPGLPGPLEILTGDPVTRADLRALVLDLAETENAWVGPPPSATLDVHYHEGSQQLRLGVDTSELGAPTVEPRGVLRVAVQTHDEFSGAAALDLVSQQLHSSRLLGQDFEVDWLDSVDVDIQATIEVAALDDPVSTLADIIAQIEDTLAPAAGFISLAEARARGSQLDEILAGPRLEHGVVDQLPPPRTSIFASDLIHAITNVAHVRAVRSISPPMFEIPTGKVARLGSKSQLILQRAGLVIRADLQAARLIAAKRRRARKLSSSIGMDRSLEPTPGRERKLARYHSIQRQLPAAYGVGPLGLPGSADQTRRVQARQLEAYLLIFDQLLANEFAQLAHAHELLSPDEGGVRTYFTQLVDDPPMALPSLLGATTDTATPEALQTWLDQQVEGDGLERRKRFLAHLLARFAEQLGDYSTLRSADSLDAAVVAERQSFLRHYPRLSGARGSGYGLRDDATSAAVERLRAKLGLPELRFELVEHILLRPVTEDRNQLDPDGVAPVPLLGDVAGPDPWSLQVSVVFEQPDIVGRTKWFEGLQLFVAQTLLAELPAHLRVHVHWLDDQGDSTWAAFSTAWTQFRTHLRAYRWPGVESADERQLAQLRLRDARDRVIDLLGLGRSYPLRDIPWPQHAVVSPGTSTTITLAFSQRGVIYKLYDDDNQPVSREGKPLEAEGTGAELTFETPPINVDVTYRVLATKIELVDPPPEGEPAPELPEPRSAWLHGAIDIREGVDASLTIEIVGLPLLDKRIDAPKPTDARIANYGASVQVAIHDCQEGVEYVLVNHAKLDAVLSAPVTGVVGTIVLTLPQATEDIDLRVRGSKSVGDAQDPDMRTAVLDLVLPLRVRANPNVAASVLAPLVAHGDATVARLIATQSSADYELWRRPIPDDEFLFDAPPSTPRIQVTGDANRLIEVLRPPWAETWQSLSGFVVAGEPLPGTGANLALPIPASTDDTCLLIRAIKHHRKESAASKDDELIDSDVQLRAALVVLVRPNHEQLLRLSVRVEEKQCVGPIVLRDGQPGVYYTLRDGGGPIALPGYFHKQDKGVDELRMELDLAIAADGDTGVAPSLEIDPLPIDTQLQVSARKAMTWLTAELRPAVLSAVPPAHLDPPAIKAGESAKLIVESSSERERYTVLLHGEPIGKPIDGDGGTIAFEIEKIEEPTEFVLIAEPIVDDKQEHLPVERRVALLLEIS